jgi:hypothetical protein
MVPVTEGQSNLSAERPATTTLNRPAGLKPFLVDCDGIEWPLIVPPAMLEEAKKRYKGIWVIANQPIKRIGFAPV